MCISWSNFHTKPCDSGHSAIDGQYLVVSNLLSGLDRYKLPRMERILSSPHTIIVNVPLQVAIVPQEGWIVCRGDNGFAQLFCFSSGKFLACLSHNNSSTL
ncbi:hypothetical protein SERLA73DRAFT_57979 [Serpula lacrymans var. lacrymans S7.3]|uniref:CNH domain-containing protein n=1 Tax=Serpula lacrymans var. lacrymans (strain S7.3) TaxID=936435 RepID=F8Q582_SERL3|nr:hypothetical protein SERLA73DRAFT_57979 [Serpula lacrymans var. lacrymans S7.3]